MSTLEQTAPAFVEVAHRIVWATVATVSADGEPRSRIMHPIWEWDGTHLLGWIATQPDSPKAADLAHEPRLSLTYWDPSQDVATAECAATWEQDAPSRHAAWDRFANGPEPVGYDPTIIPGWDNADAPSFGVLRLEPHRLRVMPGSLLAGAGGELLTWSA